LNQGENGYYGSANSRANTGEDQGADKTSQDSANTDDQVELVLLMGRCTVVRTGGSGDIRLTEAA
jgi:hypothetical protein